MKRRYLVIVGLIVCVVGGGLTWAIKRGPQPQHSWPLNQSDAVYTIHGIDNFGRGATYYVYREYEGKRDVVKVDPTTSLDLIHLTDRPVKLAGRFVTGPGGETLLKLTYVELVNK